MARGFDRADVTLAADTVTNLAALLAAEGYTGSMVGSLLEIDPRAVADLKRGDSFDVDNNGRAVTAVFRRTGPGVVDPSRYWLHSTTGGEIGVTFEPL